MWWKYEGLKCLLEVFDVIIRTDFEKTLAYCNNSFLRLPLTDSQLTK